MSAEFLFFLPTIFSSSDRIHQRERVLQDALRKISRIVCKISLTQPRWNPKLKEIFELTGLNFDDLAQFSITVEALDGISNASKEGRSPKIGSEVDFFLSAKVKGELDAKRCFHFFWDKSKKRREENFERKSRKA